MTALFISLRNAVRQRHQYNQTVAELSRMSIDTALDLDIYHGDIPRIAADAVYGR